MRIERGAILHAAGLRTHLLTSGQGGPPALLLHGLGSLGQEILAPLRDAAPGRLLLAPDRPGYGFSDPLPFNPGPIGQAHWLRHLVDATGSGKPVIVAHSIACGVALAFAALYPEKLLGLVLIAPFCRPTRHALMIGLRLTTAPVIGPAIRRALLPWLAPRIGRRRLVRAFAPEPVPPWLREFPFEHATHGGTPATMSAELLAFNRDMALCRRTRPVLHTPAHVLCAPDDSVVDRAWHVGWLADWCAECVVHFLRGGHLLHHAAPDATMMAVRALENQLRLSMEGRSGQ